MNELQNFIECLREELTQYGEMLALLDQQQDAVVRGQPSLIHAVVAAIETQQDTIQNSREARERSRLTLARCYLQPASASLMTLVSVLPSDYRPLLEALIQENNHLLTRVQQRARQNHLLLSRSLEAMRRIIGGLCTGPTPPVYNESGRILSLPMAGRFLAEAMA
jgi:hypothetical protein